MVAKETTKEIKFNHIPLEPILSHRFDIEFFDNKGNKIKFHKQSVRNFNLCSVKFEDKVKRGFKDKNFLNLKIDLMNIVCNLINPAQIFDIKKIKIDFLGPTGVISDYYSMKVELDNFELKGNYGNDELSTYKLSFFVDYLETMEDEIIKNN